MILSDFLERSAEDFPEKVAVITGGQEYRFRELEEKSTQLACYLKLNGIVRGDRVLCYLPNGIELMISMLGIAKAGAVMVVVSAAIKDQKLCHIINNCKPACLIIDKRSETKIPQALSGLDAGTRLIYTHDHGESDSSFERCITGQRKVPLSRPLDLDIASIIYTSGSTGEPKGVVMTHRNMVAATDAITLYLKKRPTDVILNTLPLSFGYGMYQYLMCLKVGATLVQEPNLTYPQQVIQLIKKHQVTAFPGVPTTFSMLLKQQNVNPDDLKSVRYITNAGAALPREYVAQLQAFFPKADIFAMYGQTECKRVSYLPPHLINEKPGSVGIPMPNTEVWIVDENGKELPRGQVGELVVRGATVMQGYWMDPKLTAERLRPGRYEWEKVLHTGDLFKMDDEGFLYFMGRRDDMIKTRGERVFPNEIENTLYRMPGVYLTRVIGTPDPVMGQAICAQIVKGEGAALTESEVLAFCRKELEPFMVPHKIEFMDSLPMSDAGKIKRK